MSFLTFGSNFSLIVCDCTNFSLFTLDFSLLATNLASFSLLATLPVRFSLFHQISHFSSRPHSHASRPFSCHRPPHSHAGLPNDMVNTMLLTGWRAATDHLSTCRRAKSEKFRVKSEKFVQSCRKSEKFEPKVRNLCVCAGKVRNSRVCARYVRNSSQKWETCVVAQS